jgi:repressor LexA
MNARASQIPNDATILTPRQIQILCFIRDYRVSNGCSPTLREIAQKFQLSRVTVFEHVEALVKKGFLQRQPNKTRSLTLKTDLKLPQDAGKTSFSGTDKSYSTPQASCYPLAGVIAAGSPLEAIENPHALDLGAMFSAKGFVFALQVQGDSMIEEQIRDGDYVLVEKNENPRDGQTVVALLESGEATLKKFYRQPDSIRLQPANSKYQPIYTKDVRIQGVVIGVIRCYI